MDIRRSTGIIIKRNNEFLVGVIIGSTETRWSRSPWDAWRTRKREWAEMVARKVNGQKMLFNPVSGELKEMGSGERGKDH